MRSERERDDQRDGDVEDQTLTAANTLSDEDGCGRALAITWKRAGSAISGGTSSTYALVQSRCGISAITVTASYTDGQGTEESVTSEVTGRRGECE